MKTIRRPWLLAAALSAAACAAGAESRPLSVDEAVRLAAGSESVRLKSLGVGKSAAQLAEAKAAAWPTLSLGVTGSLLANPPEGISVTTGELGTITLPPPYGTTVIPSQDIVFVEDAEPTYYQLDATLTQPLFTWGKIRNAVRLASLGQQVAEEELAKEETEVRRRVQKAYYGVLLAEQSREILARMQEACAEVLTDAQRRFQEGDVARQAVLEAAATSATMEAKLAEAAESVATARETLAMLTGVGPDDVQNLKLTSPFRDTLPALDEQALQDRAIEVSEDLELARLRVERAGVSAALARGSAAPRPDLALSLTFNLTGQRTPFTSAAWQDSWDWDVILSLGAKASVFDAGASAARLRQAQSDVEAAGTALSQARKLLRLAVRQAVDRARGAAASLAALEARAALAAEVERNARVSFDNGLATRAEVRTAEMGALGAALDRTLARAALEDSIEEIERLCGSLP